MNYKSKRWQTKRAKILRRDKYLCQESLRYGKRVDATTVHHILPAEFFPEYQWEDWNLISLSAEAHNKMHDRDTHMLTDAGAALARKRVPPHILKKISETGDRGAGLFPSLR